MSKTSVVINEALLQEAMRITQSKTKKQVVERGLMELIKKHNLQRLKESLGEIELDISYEDLMRQRDGT